MSESIRAQGEAFHAWVRDHAHALSGGGLWMLGLEPGRPDPADCDRAELRVLVARLSPYRDVALSQSHGLVAALFCEAGERSGRRVFADLGFLPRPSDAARLKRAGHPLLFGTLSGAPAARFDLLAFSCSHASEFLNLPWLLQGSGIPLAMRERMAREDLPLVLLGGAAACHTSPLHGDLYPGSGGLVDGVVMGDGEAAIPGLVAAWFAGCAGAPGKPALRACIARGTPGFYDPSAVRQRFAEEGRGPLEAIEPADAEAASLPFRRAAALPYPDCDPEGAFFIPFEAEALGAASLAISRGCPCACAFCREGWENRPYRERPLKAIVPAMERVKCLLGAESFHPSAFNFDMHSALFPLLEAAGRLFFEVRPKSERFDRLAAHPEAAEASVRLGKRVFTLGLEGISERLLAFLRKGITQKEVLLSMEHLARCGASEVKVFLVVTGREEEVDFRAFDSLVKEMVGRAGGAGRGRLRLVFSATPLIVQPHTPLDALERGPTPAFFEEACARLAAACASAGAELRASVKPHEIEVIQALNTGDRRWTAALAEVSARGRMLYLGQVPQGTWEALCKALAVRGLDPARFRLPRENAEERPLLPWSDISVRSPRVEAAQTAGEEKRRSAPPPPAEAWEEIQAAKKAPLAYTFTLEAGDPLRFADSGFFARAAARCLLMEEPRLAAAYLRPGPAASGPARRLAGRVEVVLLFKRGTEGELFARFEDPAFLERASGHARLLRLVSAREGPPSQPEDFETYEILFPESAEEEKVVSAITRPRKGPALPLRLVRSGKELLLLSEGRKAGRSPIREARLCRDDNGVLRLILKAKPSFDPAIVAALGFPGEPLRPVIRRH